ncbi:unnamed protein product [Rotaria sp. Silwood2]|nr:unnamed protein product [Rotaria sp. Silwood2]
MSNDNDPKWIIPTCPTSGILICHDKSTFRLDHGRFHILLDLLVQHSSNLFWSFNNQQCGKAMEKHCDLLIEGDMNYLDRSVMATSNIGIDQYFNNDTGLLQFEPLFKLLESKTEYQNHQIAALVGNARTHTAK